MSAEAAISEHIEATLEAAGLFVDVEIADGLVTLSGEVDSEENRVAALDVANAATAPRNMTVVDALEVSTFSPDSGFDRDALPLADEPWAAEVAGAPHDPNRSDPELDPDFTDDLGTTDSQVAAAEGVPYYPPTDPVVRPSIGDQSLQIAGGFAPGALSVNDDGGDPGDEDLAEAVAGALRRDALTSDLAVSVLVRGGIVYLRGDVPSVDDASAAEAIAGDVPGVVEVREELRTVGGA
ncbi:MAG: BON domain-containing protein [Chloroflexia bacterium]|nr:BON domain-containing protein [Chloroflexia bacterium]